MCFWDAVCARSSDGCVQCACAAFFVNWIGPLEWCWSAVDIVEWEGSWCTRDGESDGMSTLHCVGFAWDLFGIWGCAVHNA